MDSSGVSGGGRSHRDQGRRERHREHSSRREGSHQPKFGELIPRTLKSSSDELRQFAKTVLGDYDSTIETIQREFPRHSSRLLGVDRSQPITPISTATSFNLFEPMMKEKMNVTSEKREPPVPAGGKSIYPTFGDHHPDRNLSHKPGKTRRQSTQDSGQSSTTSDNSNKNSNRKLNSHRGKVHPYVRPNHSIMTGSSSIGLSPNQDKSIISFVSDSQRTSGGVSDLAPPTSKHPKKHKKSRHTTHQQDPVSQDSNETVIQTTSSSIETGGKRFFGAISESRSSSSNNSLLSSSPSLVDHPVSSPPLSLRSINIDTCSTDNDGMFSSKNKPEHMSLEGTSNSAGLDNLQSAKVELEKKKRTRERKQKKDMNDKDSLPTLSHMPIRTSHVTTTVGSVPTYNNYVIPSTTGMTPPTVSKGTTHHIPVKPSKLIIDPSFSLFNLEETSTDTADLQSMLKEMTLPPFLTPLHTPSTKQDSFVFTTPIINQAPLSNPNLQNSSFERLLTNEHVHSKTGTLLNTCPPPVPSAPLSTLTDTKSTANDILGDISSSDDDSSSSESEDSSSEEEDEGDINKQEKEENKKIKVEKTPDENTSFMLDQIYKQFNQPLNMLTPIKTSPKLLSHPFPLISPVSADESANLSPAKPQRNRIFHPLSDRRSIGETRNIQFETSLGFPVENSSNSNIKEVPSPSPFPVNIPSEAQTMQSESDSSSSGEESDTDSSDSDSDDEIFDQPQTSQNGNDTLKQTTSNMSQNSSLAINFSVQESKPFEFEYEDISQSEPSIEISGHERTSLKKSKSFRDSRRTQLAALTTQTDSQSQERSFDSHRSGKREREEDIPSSPNKTARIDSGTNTGIFPEDDDNRVYSCDDETPLMVHIPLSKVPELQQKTTKPQATVGPYNISASHKRTSSSTDSTAPPPPVRREREHNEGRYSSRRESSDSSYRDNYHGETSSRSHRDRRGWSVDYEGRGGSGRRGGGNDRRERWDRERYIGSSPSHHMGEDYWEYRSSTSSGQPYEGRREEPRDRGQYSVRTRGNSSDYYYERARTLKREADAFSVPGTGKAIRYMESVAYFMRHGFTQENEVKWESGISTNSSKNNTKAFKIYSDTLTLLKHCMKIGSDCKPLQAICLRCHGVLLWRMYVLKQSTVMQHHKELQDVFNSSSKLPQKSPNPPGSFSPLPSPASVGSTNSSCSGVGPAYNVSQEQNVPITRPVCAKVNEYLTLTGYVHQGVDLWKQSEIFAEHYRDIFISSDRKIGHITQFSPVAQVADWMEDSLVTIANRFT